MVSPLVRQIFTAFGPIAIQFSHAYILGLNSLIVPSLKKPDSNIHLSLSQESWLPCILILMLLPSQLISGLMTVKYGRKLVFCISTLPNIPTAIIAYGAQDFKTLFLAYCIGGFIGGGLSIGPWIIAETCSPNIRGILLNFREIALYFGFASSHFLGLFCDWRTLILCAIVPSILGFIIITICPESPAWLASKGRFEECRSSFCWYRGENDKLELEQLIECQKKIQMIEKMQRGGTSSKIGELLGYLLERTFWKATLISFACITCFSMCGKQIFALFITEAIKQITNDADNAYYYATSLDFLDFFCLCVACFTIKNFKRRRLLFVTAFVAVISVLLFCLVQYLYSNQIVVNRFPWLPFVLITLYFFMLGIGVMPVVFTLLSEVFPLAHRALSMATNSLIFVFLAFGTTKMSPWLMKECGMHGVFLVNTTFLVISLVILYYTIPETYNLTMQDIENEMRGDSFGDSLDYKLVAMDENVLVENKN